MKLFSGTSNVPLAQEVAKLLKIPLSQSRVTRFSNSETKVQLLEKVEGETCVVLQSTSNPTDTNLLELLFFCDALRRQEAAKVVGVIPYFGYARQDMQHAEGESVSANVIIRFLETVGFDKIYTIDLHNEATGAVFSIPFKNMSAMPILAKKTTQHLSKKIKITPENVSLVIPDQGALEQGRRFGEAFFKTQDFSLAVVEKKRSGENVTSFGLHGDIKGKHIIMVDDMIVTGNTLIGAMDYIKKRHEIASLTVVATHHDFDAKAPARLQNSSIDALITTNSIQLLPSVKIPKLQEVSLAPVIADELKNCIQ